MIQQLKGDKQVRGPKSPICPLCGSEFHIKHVDMESPFRCPTCDKYICVSRGSSYVRIQICAAICISVVLSYVFGARSATVALAALFMTIPVLFIIVFWAMHFAPPKLKPCLSEDSHYSGPLGLSK
jgi:uncharacterized paraquat-inducible protein A